MKSACSIIIPALNEEEFIGGCLYSISQLRYPKDLIEVIVVDNGSIDRTVDIARRYQARILSQKDCTVSQLRNLGAQAAKNPILAFVDADCSVPSDWLKNALALLHKEGVGAVGCWYKLPVNKTTWVDSVWDIHMRQRRESIGEVNWVPSGNFIISRKVFSQIKGFDESLMTSEDVDICTRIRNTGLAIYSHPKLAAEHLGEPHSISKYFKKESWRGKGVFQNFLRNLPQLKLNKAIVLAFLTLISCAGVIVGAGVDLISGKVHLLMVSTAILLFVPLALSFKTLMGKKQKWKYLMPLAFLFLIYSVARASSLCEPKVWSSFQNQRFARL